VPQENRFIDIWQHEHEAKPVIQEGSLRGEDLDLYLESTPDVANHGDIIGGLRLIYSCADEEADHNHKTVFWSKPDFVKVLESFQLPKRFTQMIGKCHCLFAEFPPKTLGGQNRYGYIFSTMFHHEPLWYVAASWDPEANTTYAFMHCTADPEWGYISAIKQALAEMPPRGTLPMLLPILIMDLETNGTLGDDEEWTETIRDIENQTKQRPRETDTVDVQSLDLPSIVQRLNGASIFLSLIEKESEIVLLQLAQVRQALSDFEVKHLGVAEPSRSLMHQVDFLVVSRKSLFVRLQNLQRRCQTQLAFVYGFLAQRDNMLGGASQDAA